MADVLNNATEQTLRDYELLRDSCGRLELPSVTGIVLTGEDRKGWLQGQVTNDVRKLEGGTARSFCLCSTTGQIQAVVDAWAWSDRIVMTTATETVPAVMDRIERMVILEDVVGELAIEKYQLVSIQGPTATRQLSGMLDLPNLDAGDSQFEDATVWCLRADRTGLGGWDIWLPADRSDLISNLSAQFEVVGNEAYNIARLEAGIPIYGIDINHKTMPPELGPTFEAKHMSYHKGCYMGQEVLMRLHSRGHTNRTWVGLLADGPLEAGATISHPSRPDAGVVTSAVVSPDFGPIGAAMIRNEFAETRQDLSVHTSKGVIAAEVRQMPLLRLE